MQIMILCLPILFFCIIIHECAHGYVALHFGDTTAQDMGRLTLNPLPHIDLFGTIILPLMLLMMKSGFLFGWAKPVPVNPYNFDDPKRDMMWVALAGPVSNLLLAVVFSILYHLLMRFTGLYHLMRFTGVFGIVSLVFGYGVVINLVLAVFNLIPVPPLDGSRVLSGLLPEDLAYKYERITPFGFIIIFVLLMGGLFSILWPIVAGLAHLLGVRI